MDKDERIEMVRQILDHLATDEAPQWKRIRKEIQWTIFWPLTKAVVLFWLIYVALWLIGGQ